MRRHSGNPHSAWAYGFSMSWATGTGAVRVLLFLIFIPHLSGPEHVDV